MTEGEKAMYRALFVATYETECWRRVSTGKDIDAVEIVCIAAERARNVVTAARAALLPLREGWDSDIAEALYEALA